MCLSSSLKGMPSKLLAEQMFLFITVMAHFTCKVAAAVLFDAVGVRHLEVPGVPILGAEEDIISFLFVGIVNLWRMSNCIPPFVLDLPALVSSLTLHQVKVATSFPLATLVTSTRGCLFTGIENKVFSIRSLDPNYCIFLFSNINKRFLVTMLRFVFGLCMIHAQFT